MTQAYAGRTSTEKQSLEPNQGRILPYKINRSMLDLSSHIEFPNTVTTRLPLNTVARDVTVTRFFE